MDTKRRRKARKKKASVTGMKSAFERLAKSGWSERFIASEPRLSEVAENYREAGFEVHLEPLPQELDCRTCTGEEESTECRICFEGVEDQYRVLFTRPISKPGQDEAP